MCNFFSCIAMKNKKVIWEKGIDNHHELLEMHNITDDTIDPVKMKIASKERAMWKKINANQFLVDLVLVLTIVAMFTAIMYGLVEQTAEIHGRVHGRDVVIVDERGK